MSTSYVTSLKPCLMAYVPSFYGVIESFSDGSAPGSIKLFVCGELSMRLFCAAAPAFSFIFFVDCATGSCLLFCASLRQRIDPITAVPAFLRRRRALNLRMLGRTWGSSSLGVPSPLTQGCAMIPSASRRS